MIIQAILQTVLIILGVNCGVLFILCVDRKLGVVSQHRIGPASGSYRLCFHVFADILKALLKKDPTAPQGRSHRIFWWATFVLPYLFVLVLFSTIAKSWLGEFELLVLFIIFLAARVFDSFGLISDSEAGEAVRFRQNLALSIVAITIMIFSCLTVILKTGGSSLTQLANYQADFPFYLMFRGPGVFLSAVAFLWGMFLISGELLIGESRPKSLNGGRNHAFVFVDRLWLFALSCFWVALFLGGPLRGAFIFLYLLRVGILLTIVLWSGRVMSSVRPHDALELGMTVVLPATLVAFVIEGAYVAWAAVGVP